MKGNCMTGCRHCIVKDIYKPRTVKDELGNVCGTINEHVGYQHLCDGGHQKEYDEWHERNKDNTYEVYKKDCLECYDPTDVAASLNNMIELAKELLQKIDEKKL